MAKVKPLPPGSMSPGKAYLRGGTIVLLTIGGLMLVPLAHDIYRVIKNWLLKEEQPQLPPGPLGQ